MERMMTTSGFHKNNTGLVWVSLPLLVVLFASISWETDRRTETDADRLLKLRDSRWSWDKAEYETLLERIDINQYVGGRPLFVVLAIEGRNKSLLQKMIRRGADLNSTSWRCTALLATLDLSNEAWASPSRAELAEVLIRSGADPNLIPKDTEVDKRIASGSPSTSCKSFDGISRERRSSVLRVFIELANAESTVELLVEKGARPGDRLDSKAILKKAMSGWTYRRLEQSLTELALRHGASLDDDDDQTGTPLMRAVRGTLGPEQVDQVRRFIKLGADPNQRSAEDMLPLQVAIDGCVNSDRVFSNQDEEKKYLYPFLQEQWVKADLDARIKNGKTLQLVVALLQGGADPNLPIQQGAGESILTYAISRCASDVPNALLNHGAKVTASAIEAAHFGLRERLLRTDNRYGSRTDRN